MRMNHLKKILAIAMCAVFMLSSGACDIAEQIRNSVHERIVIQSEIPVQELTRLIISSINDKRNTADAYSQIPSAQLDGLSYSYFYEYLNIIRTVSTQYNNGKVVSFRIMGDEECSDLLGRDVSSRFGQIKGAQLMYSTEVEYPVYIFFSVDEDGRAYLSKDWVTSIINIYNYSKHYFTLLDESNADAVKALLAPGFVGDEYTDEVIYTKALQLCDFYRLRVMSNTNEFEITRLVPWEMTIRIPETITSDGSLFEEHYVNITLQDSGSYYIDDKISVAQDNNLAYLVRGDEKLIRVGSEYTYDQLVMTLGTPSAVNFNDDNNLMILIYPGVILRFDDVDYDSENWNGSLSSIRLIGSSAYSIGYNLFVGMTRTQVLLAYPFIDDSNYVLNLSGGLRDLGVEFGFDEYDTISFVKVYD